MRNTVTLVLAVVTFSLQAQQNTENLTRYLSNNAVSPEEYVIQKFKTNDVVLLGERHLVKQNLLFVQRLIPMLYSQGVRTIGMEFGAYENQSRLDSLTTATQFNAAFAEKMMF